ncbi:hypothetical protein [Novosphingobium sp. B-7]|uniref:hypothetical protein n=1 Tax=Novosphingobium sp. B-7 TaxID=1298855 RepID=UPI0011D238CB|nr:hypothetical protein [Novosphingobium sp. B-7]
MREINAVAIPHPARRAASSNWAMAFRTDGMDETTSAVILCVIEHAPQCIRHDLDAKDEAIRTRAEVTLAAMIVGMLREGSGEAGTA